MRMVVAAAAPLKRCSRRCYCCTSNVLLLHRLQMRQLAGSQHLLHRRMCHTSPGSGIFAAASPAAAALLQCVSAVRSHQAPRSQANAAFNECPQRVALHIRQTQGLRTKLLLAAQGQGCYGVALLDVRSGAMGRPQALRNVRGSQLMPSVWVLV